MYQQAIATSSRQALLAERHSKNNSVDYGSLERPHLHKSPTSFSASVVADDAPVRQLHSFPYFDEPPKATWSAKMVAARPEAAIDHRLEKAIKACSSRSHSWIVRPSMRNRPATVLVVFACTGLAVGTSSVTFAAGQRLRQRTIDDGLRRGPEWLYARMGAVPAVPAALVCDAAAISVSLGCNAMVCLAGATACVVSPLAALPLVCSMPEGMRAALADGLCNYLVLHERLDELKTLISPASWRASGQRKNQKKSFRQRYNELFAKLRDQVSTLSEPTEGGQALSPAQANFRQVVDLTEAHPICARLLGVPLMPTQATWSRLQPEPEAT